MTHLIGVDVGGTKIAAGLVGPAGELLDGRVVPTPARDGPRAVLDAIVDAVRDIPGHVDAAGVGVGTGGVIDRERGVVVAANDLLPGWAGTPVGAELSGRLGLPVAVDNDANVFALAEHLHGAGRGCSSALYVAVGTGIGGALVVGDRIWRGAHWTAGEFGHLPVPEARGRRCNCGHTGHLEAVAAGPSITRQLCERTGETLDLREIIDRAADPGPARDVLGVGARALGSALAGLVNTFDPQCVVVGGGVAEAGARFWEPMGEAFAAGLLPGPSGLVPQRARLGPRSAVIGAAALMREPGVLTNSGLIGGVA